MMKLFIVINPQYAYQGATHDHYKWAIYPMTSKPRTASDILLSGKTDTYEQALAEIETAKHDIDINNSAIQEAINTHYRGQ